MLPNYQCVRRDRDRHGGDVLMFIHSSLVYNVLCRDVVDCELLVVSPHKFCLAVYYRPPSAPLDSLTHISSALLSISPSYSNNLILLGDFNVNFFDLDSALGRHLMFCLAPFNLTQVITSGTHTSSSGNCSLIDLVFFTDPTFLHSWSLIHPLGNSDHPGELEVNKTSKMQQQI